MRTTMPTVQPYQISTSKQEVVITLNRSLIEQDKLEQFLDYLTIKAIQQKSQLSEESANQLISEIDKAMWEKQKGLFEL
jgi:hypothetical protein